MLPERGRLRLACAGAASTYLQRGFGCNKARGVGVANRARGVGVVAHPLDGVVSRGSRAPLEADALGVRKLAGT